MSTYVRRRVRFAVRLTAALLRDLNRALLVRAWTWVTEVHRPYEIDNAVPALRFWCSACRTLSPCPPLRDAQGALSRLRNSR